jgi:hypothetical protein
METHHAKMGNTARANHTPQIAYKCSDELAVSCTDLSYKELNLPCIYLGITVTNQDYIYDETKSRLISGSGCYHTVQNILSS